MSQEQERRKPKREPAGDTKKHTIERSGPFKMASFGWLNELIWVSQANPWTQEMNYDLPKYDRVEKNKRRFIKAFKSTKNSQASLLRAYFLEILVYQLANITYMVLNSLAQQKTSEVGSMINKGTLYHDTKAALAFAWMLALSEGYLFVGNTIKGFFEFTILRVGLAAKTGVYSVLQDKIMSFSPMNSREVREGFITNLIQVDSMNIDEYFFKFNLSLSCLLSIGVSLYFMVTAIEWRLSLGFVLAIVFIRVLFLLIFVAVTYYQNRYLKAKDRRMDLLKNVLENVDFVKINRLENFFCLELYEKREVELMELRGIAVAISFFEMYKRALNKVPSLIIIILVVYFIPSKMSFSDYLFFLQLGTTLNQNISGLCDVGNDMIVARVSMKRIDKFLLARERDGDIPNYKRLEDSDNLVAIEVLAGNFKWRFNESEQGSCKGSSQNSKKINTKKINRTKGNSNISEQLLSRKYSSSSGSTISFQDGSEWLESIQLKEAEVGKEEGQFYLTDVNLKIKKGETVVVLGKNCSGRSSLLYSLLGEMLPATEQSTVIVNGSVAFMSQARWMLGMSVKENIILGSGYDEERMNEALRCSQLVKDITTFQNGLDTSVGDNGDTVSGGQRARIALARCFYQE